MLPLEGAGTSHSSVLTPGLYSQPLEFPGVSGADVVWLSPVWPGGREQPCSAHSARASEASRSVHLCDSTQLWTRGSLVLRCSPLPVGSASPVKTLVEGQGQRTSCVCQDRGPGRPHMSSAEAWRAKGPGVLRADSTTGQQSGVLTDPRARAPWAGRAGRLMPAKRSPSQASVSSCTSGARVGPVPVCVSDQHLKEDRCVRRLSVWQ